VRVSILIALFSLACERKPEREISKQLDMTNNGGKTQTCVEGDEAICRRAGGHWLGSRCCLPKASCAFGDEAACARVVGTWTGKYCCLAPEYRFATGDKESCAKLAGAWTGKECLVK
jgi:hypothetical protein